MNQFRCCFFSAQYEAALAFYRDDLGLAIIGSWDRSPDDRGTLFGAGAGVIEVLAQPGNQERDLVSDYRPPQGVMIVIEVEDVDAWYQRAVSKVLPLREPIVNQKWGHRSFRLTDPDGLTLYFFSEIVVELVRP